MNPARRCRSAFERPSEDAVAAEGRVHRTVARAGVGDHLQGTLAGLNPNLISCSTDAHGAVIRRSTSRGCCSYGVAVWSAAFALGLLLPASAHDVWADGSQIPVWVKTACCGKDEAHLLRPSQVHKVEGGYRIDGYPLIVPDTSALPSQDGNYWAFYQIYGIVNDKPQVSNIRCFFVPLGV